MSTEAEDSTQALGGADPEPTDWVPTSTHQLLESSRAVLLSLQSPRGKTQDVFLVLLDLGHGPAAAVPGAPAALRLPSAGGE